jgi:mRNA interferase MazF
MSTKDYAAWHIQKTTLDARENTQYFYEQEVWWLALGCNVGFEEDGKGQEFARPVIVLHKFSYRFFFGVPVSSTANVGRFYCHMQSSPGFSTALLSQARPLDARRLIKQAGRLSDTDFARVHYHLTELINGHKNVFPPLLGA